MYPVSIISSPAGSSNSISSNPILDRLDGSLRAAVRTNPVTQLLRFPCMSSLIGQGLFQEIDVELVHLPHAPCSGRLDLSAVVTALEDGAWEQNQRHSVDQGLDDGILPAMADRPIAVR